MAQVRLSHERRQALLKFMMERYDEKHNQSPENAMFDELIKLVNKALRVRYPEKDMVVLRKYRLTRQDVCLRFAILDTGRVFDVNFRQNYELRLKAEKHVVDIPARAGCQSSEAFACDQNLADTSDIFFKLIDDQVKAREEKRNEYNAFLHAAKTLDEVEAVVPLPAALRTKLGAVNALITLSDEAVANIRADFAAPAA